MYRIDHEIREEYCKSINKECLLIRKFNESNIEKTIKEIYMSSAFIAGNMKGRRYIQEEIFEYFKVVTKEILDFFNNHKYSLSEEEYDEFFFRLSINFLNTYNEYGLKNGNVKELKYGMSEKLFNLIFKHLSCFEDYDLYPHLFEYCHICLSVEVLYYFKIHNLARGIDASRGEVCSTPYLTADYSLPKGLAHYNLNKFNLKAYQTLLNDYRSNLKNMYPKHSLLNCEFYILKYVKEYREDDTLIFKLSKEY